MGKLDGLKPEKVFEIFEMLCSVPHGSGNTKQISDLIKEFADKRGLYNVQEPCGNVIIKKPASTGFESAPPVVLQGHMDMVAVKTPDCPIDMKTEGLRLKTDGEWVWADGTSLGGDDGVAVAIALALLDDDTLVHPPLEVLITVDEETDMVGAKALDPGLIDSRLMINLDSEEEGVFTVSCAGGIACDCVFPINTERKLFAGKYFEISISGLTGGHSGAEIHRQRANANKLMFRLLLAMTESCDLGLVEIDGGEFENVIPKSCTSKIWVAADDVKKMLEIAEKVKAEVKDEFSLTDPLMSIKVTETEYRGSTFDRRTSARIINVGAALPDGVQRMCPSIPGFVQTSLNMGVVRISQMSAKLTMSLRSSVASEKHALASKVSAICRGMGAAPVLRREYPEWEFRRESKLRETAVRSYVKLCGEEPVVKGVHAGLECGIFSEKLKGLDAVSMGPDLRDIHSVNERLSAGSTERLYDLVKEILRELALDK